MKKSDLTSRVGAETSLPQGAVEGAVNAMFSGIGKARANGEAVSVARSGTFSTRKLPAQRGRNPRTGESIEIVASTVPSFNGEQGSSRCDAVTA